MGKKMNTPTAGSLPAIRIGTRVRCTDDGVEGRIAWANATSVKVKWDDGEEVTWKRADLAGKPIEFLDIEQTEQPVGELAPAQPATAEMSAPGPATPLAPVTQESTTAETPIAERPGTAPASKQPAPAGEEAPAPPAQVATAERPTAAGTDASSRPPLEMPGRPNERKRRRAERAQRQAQAAAEPKEKKLSAIDAAAKVLAETGTPMSCKELIAAMAAKGYWTSPGGRTPDATLHASVLREISVKREQSRFVKAAPGRFALRPTV
jgi:hypothetical protein